MPDFMTHCLFANDSRNALPEGRRELLANQEKLLNLGAQGPDPLFYHGRTPWTKDKGYPLLANALHTRKTDAFLHTLWRMVREAPPTSFEALYAYAWGFTGHYALDTECHPYVYAQAGYAFNGAPKTRQMTANHVILEAAIDTLLVEEKTGVSLKKVRIDQMTPKTLPLELDAFYQGILPEYGFHAYGSGDFNQAVRDMQLAQRFLYDPCGWKEALCRVGSRLAGHTVYFGKPIYPSVKYLQGVDCLNLEHNSWTHPLDETDVHTESFLDLYQQALKRMHDYAQRIEAYLIGEFLEPGLFEGYSYDSKLRWDGEKNARVVRGEGLMNGRL